MRGFCWALLEEPASNSIASKIIAGHCAVSLSPVNRRVLKTLIILNCLPSGSQSKNPTASFVPAVGF
jgi:hypothetical protein